jgi:protein SERAC1
MLTVSNIAEDHQKKILQCTRAIAFLGTPHRGSGLASLAVFAGNMATPFKRPNISILKTLTPNSEVLENINHEFHTLLRSREQSNLGAMNITCFAEELAMSKMGKTFHVPIYTADQVDLSSLISLSRSCHISQLF